MMPTDRFHYLVETLNSLPALPTIGVTSAVAGVLIFGFANILVQATSADISWVEHLTLESALVIAVVVLWRALTAKDAKLDERTKNVTDALAASAASNVELRSSNERLGRIIEASLAANEAATLSKDHLSDSLNLFRAAFENAKNK